MKLFRYLLAAATLLSVVVARAQENFDKMVYNVGTTTQVGADYWAYILFQPVKLDLLDGKTITIYEKSGNAASASPYALKTVIQGAHTDPSVIKPLLARSELLGQNLAELSGAINALYQDLIPSPSVPLENRISAVVTGAVSNVEKRKNLFVLSRQHPAMALVLGQAYALKLPSSGIYTYEVRQRTSPTATGGSSADDRVVLGRVTLNPLAPVVLPAPGQPFEVVDTSSRGDLHAQLRWASPTALRELSLLQYGFNLYRMPRTFAVSSGYNTTPPTPAQLATAIAGGNAKKINRVPILADKEYDSATVADPLNKEFYVADDNDRYNGGAAFVDGSKWWYFVTARDLLGRNGSVSPGREVIMCDRVRSMPPEAIRVTNEALFSGGTRTQWLRVHWKKPSAPEPTGFARYLVYRWTNVSHIATNQNTYPAEPAASNPNLIAVIPSVPAQTDYSFDDKGLPGSPTQPADNGRAFWYTVRAVDGSTCANVSFNSTPQFGVLRDREGPQAADGGVMITCFCPDVTFFNATLRTSNDPLNRNLQNYVLVCENPKGDPSFAFADFRSGNSFLGRVPVETATGKATLPVALPPEQQGKRELFCRLILRNGKMSDWVKASELPGHESNQIMTVTWKGVRRPATVMAGEPRNPCSDRFDPVNPDTGGINPPVVTFNPPATSQEYKIYRRVDDGELSMIKQGTYPEGFPGPVTYADDNPPSTYARLCYYVQCFDEHGNPSPMALLACLECCAELPVPMLSAIEAVGNEASPKMRVNWFCSPYGVERFEILIARSSNDFAINGPSELSADRATHPNTMVFDAGSESYDFGVYETAMLAGLSATTTAEFITDIPVSLGDTQRVMIRAVGPGEYGSRCTGNVSNGETFSWVAATPPVIDVPWPARPLPGIDNAFLTGLNAAWLQAARPNLGVGIAIGSFTINNSKFFSFQNQTEGRIVNSVMDPAGKPEVYLYKNNVIAAEEGGTLGGTILPYALFRFQKANAKFPTVSGDIVQVSPMLEEIAYQSTTVNGDPAVLVKDQFVAALLDGAVAGATGIPTPAPGKLYALDRTPVVRGALYKYLFIRFNQKTKEIDRVVPAGEITIP